MVFKNFFSRYLFLSNSITFTGLFALGDFIEQQRERQRQKKACEKVVGYDIARTLRMVTIGALLSPTIHFWYVALDKVIVGNIHHVVARKVLADEIIMSPILTVLFLGGMSKLEGSGLNECCDEVRMKFWPTYKADLAVWPAAQALNFYIVPAHYRVAYVSAITILWNTFLSYIKHKKED